MTTPGATAVRHRERHVMVARRAHGFAEALSALLRARGGRARTAALDDLGDALGRGEGITLLVDVDDAGEEAVGRLRAQAATLLALTDGPGPDRGDVDGWVSPRQLAATPALEELRAAPSRGAVWPEGADAALDRLTAREREVLAELAAGRSYHELADALGITAHTVRTHVRNLLGKLDVVTRLEAVALARRAGLVPTREAVR